MLELNTGTQMANALTIVLISAALLLLLIITIRGLQMVASYVPPRKRPLWVITCYFNPSGYASIKRNYDRFIAEMKRSGVPVKTVELSYTGNFVITGHHVIHVHAKDAMWHKERLLNIALYSLPKTCKYVAWVDADITFLNENWVADTIAKFNGLRSHAVVQLFEQVQMLDPVGNFYKSAYGYAFSHATGFVIDPCNDRYPYQNPDNHKHTGFAWAARISYLKAIGGFYDKHIMGGGDYQMALGFYGHFNDPWYERFIGEFKKDLVEWSRKCHQIIQGNVGYVQGGILHHWHGHADDRNYIDRTKILNEYEYDPNVDIKLNRDDVWEWATHKHGLHAAVKAYFNKRNDDACHPVNPTRYHDKVPVIMSNVKDLKKFQACLNSLSHQTRMDFVVHVLCADWTICQAAKQLVRSHAWPFEIRFRVFSGVPLLPRRLEAAYLLKRETKAKRAIFVDAGHLYPERHVADMMASNTTIHHGGEIKAVCLAKLDHRLVKLSRSRNHNERVVVLACC